MNNGDVLAELDRTVIQTRRALQDGTLQQGDYAHGLMDGLHGFRRFVRSEQYARILRLKKTTTTETPRNADRH